MTRKDLVQKVLQRKKDINITLENISKLSGVANRTVNRFFAGKDVKLSTVEKITNLLGLDFSGNEIVTVKELRDNRAKKNALYIVGLVQDTSALEEQGLENTELNILISETKEQFLNGFYKKKLWSGDYSSPINLDLKFTT
jgi:transcriptional regulator with XRE-family HTH domain